MQIVVGVCSGQSRGGSRGHPTVCFFDERSHVLRTVDKALNRCLRALDCLIAQIHVGHGIRKVLCDFVQSVAHPGLEVGKAIAGAFLCFLQGTVVLYHFRKVSVRSGCHTSNGVDRILAAISKTGYDLVQTVNVSGPLVQLFEVLVVVIPVGNLAFQCRVDARCGGGHDLFGRIPQVILAADTLVRSVKSVIVGRYDVLNLGFGIGDSVGYGLLLLGYAVGAAGSVLLR